MRTKATQQQTDSRGRRGTRVPFGLLVNGSLLCSSPPFSRGKAARHRSSLMCRSSAITVCVFVVVIPTPDPPPRSSLPFFCRREAQQQRARAKEACVLRCRLYSDARTRYSPGAAALTREDGKKNTPALSFVCVFLPSSRSLSPASVAKETNGDAGK